MTVASMYLTLLGPILAGIINSLWCKSRILKGLQTPLDGGKNFLDGKRIFGDNKTWKGFLGYLVLNVICMVLCGVGCRWLDIEYCNMFYQGTTNNLWNNVWIGLLLGMAYALFELPNSFLKRRLDIRPGKSVHGVWKVFFVFFDQADSVFGCVLVVCLYAPMTVAFYFTYVLVGAVTHIVINMLLYIMKLRKNMC